MSGPGPILGIDIGGTKIAVCVGTPQADILHRTVFPCLPERGFGTVFEELSDHIDQSLGAVAGIERIGVSVGGPLDAATGTLLGPPHLPGWAGIPLKRMLEERFGRRTYVAHDAKAGALAEWRFGAGQGVDNLVFLTLGTGLGAGIISDGRLLSGRAGLAGEIGHWRVAEDGPEMYGKRGSWESFVSGAGLASLARYRYPAAFPGPIDAHEVHDRAVAGDEHALAVVRESAHRLGAGLALLVDLLAPEIIVLGSLAQRLGDPYVQTVSRAMRAETLAAHKDCPITTTDLGEHIGDVAAICAVLYQEAW